MRAQLHPLVAAICSPGDESESYCQVVTPPPSVYDTVLPASIRWTADSGAPMPLIDYLKDHFDRGTAWHRNDERLARGLPKVSSPAVQLEGWERELVWTETLLLTGTAEASFRHLARGWGRDKGFHRVLAQSICDRHGNVERKPAAIINSHGNSSTTATLISALLLCRNRHRRRHPRTLRPPLLVRPFGTERATTNWITMNAWPRNSCSISLKKRSCRMIQLTHSPTSNLHPHDSISSKTIYCRTQIN
jgi:hypothetical protein